jgi:hypothetical protein
VLTKVKFPYLWKLVNIIRIFLKDIQVIMLWRKEIGRNCNQRRFFHCWWTELSYLNSFSFTFISLKMRLLINSLCGMLKNKRKKIPVMCIEIYSQSVTYITYYFREGNKIWHDLKHSNNQNNNNNNCNNFSLYELTQLVIPNILAY